MAEDDIRKVLNVPLGYIRRYPRPRRSQIAVRHLRKYVARHMRVGVDDIWIGDEVNLLIWERGMRSPPKLVRVLATKLAEQERVDVNLPEEEEEEAEGEKGEKEEEAVESGGSVKPKKKQKAPKREAGADEGGKEGGSSDGKEGSADGEASADSGKPKKKLVKKSKAESAE